jgi:DNA uptake protein ComE-like DNA-binding protein
MKVLEGQRVGGLILLIAALAVYGGLLLHDLHPISAPPLPWGDQGLGTITVEVTGSRGADGIYFLPEATASAELSKITGNDTPMAHTGLTAARLSSASAFAVSTEEGVLRTTELSAVKRLALGLPIDLNRATQEELLLVPGIGEQTAARIVHMRELRGDYERLQDLTAVPGIKERKLRNLEKYLVVGPMP